jgi:hypothetical protein
MKLNKTITSCLLLAISTAPIHLQANWPLPSLSTIATFLEKNVVPAAKIVTALASVGYAGYLAWHNRHTIEDWARTHRRPQPAPAAQQQERPVPQDVIDDLIQRNTQLTQELDRQQPIMSHIQQIRNGMVALARHNVELKSQIEQLERGRTAASQGHAQAIAQMETGERIAPTILQLQQALRNTQAENERLTSQLRAEQEKNRPLPQELAQAKQTATESARRLQASALDSRLALSDKN